MRHELSFEWFPRLPKFDILSFVASLFDGMLILPNSNTFNLTAGQASMAWMEMQALIISNILTSKGW